MEEHLFIIQCKKYSFQIGSSNDMAGNKLEGNTSGIEYCTLCCLSTDVT